MLLTKVFLLINFSLFIVSLGFKNSLACGCRGCIPCGNEVASWGPSRIQQKPIYPLRGCGPNGCGATNTRSAIIYPCPSPQPLGQVIVRTAPIPGSPCLY